ncbi:hypothetical protein KM043_008683 [Ampulex compressa]|nr:hypothetical protein KM043_008683 [Ampulex compressa]
MPGKIKVKILAGRNLPVMDRSGDTTDAYVELKFGNVTYKTDVCRKSLNPQWNSEWYRFEVDDAELQDEPLQIRLMDHDTYSANDAIGKVYVNLNPLLLPGVSPPAKNIWALEAALSSSSGSQTGSVMSGWIPVYDTMHGIRGEVNIIIKVELFSDFNKFRQSSCGVQFFYSPNIPYGYHAQSVHGFVEELIVSDDPEYKWIDKIRTPRASNEARQTLFFKLSGEVQRKIGLKALDLGGNAVIGYLQNFDLEGESGIVARGIGTAVTLVKLHDIFNFPSDNINVEEATLAFLSRSKPTERLLLPFSYPASSLIHAQSMHRSHSCSCCTKIPRDVQKTTIKSQMRNRWRSKVVNTKSSYMSLTDSLIGDTSLCAMLALEDMRGELSRPKVVARLNNLKKIFGGVEEEAKSACNPRLSALMGVPGSFSNLQLGRGQRKDRSPRSRVGGEEMASLLIKSIHSMPLDSVEEVHEVPPSGPATRQPSEESDRSTSRKSCVLSNSNSRDKIDKNEKLQEEPLFSENFDKRSNDFCEPPEKRSEQSEEFCESSKEFRRQSEKSHESSEEFQGSAGEFCEVESGKRMIIELSSSSESSDDEERSHCSTRYNTLEDSEVSTDSDSLSRSRSSEDDKSVCEEEKPLFKGDSPTELESPLQKAHGRQLEKKKIKTEDIQRVFKAPESIFRVFCSEQDPKFASDSRLENLRKCLGNEDTKKVGENTSGIVVVKLIDEEVSFSSSDSQLEVLKRSFVYENATMENKNIADKGRKGKLPKVFDFLRRSSKTECSDLPIATSTPIEIPTDIFPAKEAIQETSFIVKNKTDASFDKPLNESDVKLLYDYKRYAPRIRINDSETPTSRSPSKEPQISRKSLKTRHRLQKSRSNVGKGEPIGSRRPLVLSCDAKQRRNFPETSDESSRSDNKARKDCMLELMKLIDAKMMVHERTDASRIKRRKRYRGYRYLRHEDTFHSHSHIPKDLPLAELRDGSKSSNDSLCPRDDSSTPTTRRLARSRSGEPSKTILEDRASGIVGSIEKTNDRLSSRERAILGKEASSSRPPLDGAASTNTVGVTYKACVSRPSPHRRQQDESSLSSSYQLPTVSATTAATTTATTITTTTATTTGATTTKVSQSPATKAPLHRRSSDSDLSVTPKGGSLSGCDRSIGGLLRAPNAFVRPTNQDPLEMLEYPFITVQQYPPGFITHIGGLVSSRSVKLLERISNLEEPEGRDSWWTEIRMEVRSHARALACNVVIGYKEETSICDDVCVLNASGTAAVINLHNPTQDQDTVLLSRLQQTSIASTIESDRERVQQKSLQTKPEKTEIDVPSSNHNQQKTRHTSESRDQEVGIGQPASKCNLCHLPYSEASVPFKVSVSKCAICKRGKVPDVMFTTIEPPESIPTTGRGCFIQATVCKSKKDLRGELNAKEISDCLPFLEYELHSLLLNKLKVKGMNAIFGLKLQISIGERLIIGMAVGTAVFLTALPTPSVPQIASGNSWHNEEQLSDIRKTLVETLKKNREFYRLKPIGDIENGRVNTSDTDDSEEELPELDFGVGTRDTCVLEVDDIEDMDRISLLMDDRPPEDFHVVNTQTIPGLEDLEIVRNLQMFTQVSRAKIPAGQFASMPSKYFAKLLQSVYFKLRRMVPCALCDMQFKVALPEQDEIQFTVIGMALGLGEPVRDTKLRKKLMTHSYSKDQVKNSDDSDMIFTLDVDHTDVSATENSSSAFPTNSTILGNVPGQKSRPRSPLWLKPHTAHRHKHVPLKGRYGVDITPLSYLPGGRIERYLGNLNFFFIRESTSIRENGGLSGFTHSFVMEVLAIVRAHITALGGNAMVAFFMSQCVLLHSPHKNQGQSLINIGGDVVCVSYFKDEKHGGASNC